MAKWTPIPPDAAPSRRLPILERFAQQALGHNSKAVHHAYSTHAEVTVPLLDDWESGWAEKLKAEMPKPEVVRVDYKGARAEVVDDNESRVVRRNERKTVLGCV